NQRVLLPRWLEAVVRVVVVAAVAATVGGAGGAGRAGAVAAVVALGLADAERSRATVGVDQPGALVTGAAVALAGLRPGALVVANGDRRGVVEADAAVAADLVIEALGAAVPAG